MTFEEALKNLAQKRPTEFCYYSKEDGFDSTTFHFYKDREEKYISPYIPTQDDIDAILAEIFWSYEVRSPKYYTAEWEFVVWKGSGNNYMAFNNGTFYGSKLEAAKAALVAVVEKEYPL